MTMSEAAMTAGGRGLTHKEMQNREPLRPKGHTGPATLTERVGQWFGQKIVEPIQKSMHRRQMQARPIGGLTLDQKASLDSRWTKGSPTDTVNQVVAAGKDVAVAGQEFAGAVGQTIGDHKDELVDAARVGAVGLALMGAAKGMNPNTSEKTSAMGNPAMVRTAVDPSLKGYVDGVKEFTPSVSDGKMPFDSVARVAPLEVPARPNISAPSVNPATSAEISQAITGLEQHEVAKNVGYDSAQITAESRAVNPSAVASEPIPDVVEASPESVTASKPYNISQIDHTEPTDLETGSSIAETPSVNSQLEKDVAEAVTAAEKRMVEEEAAKAPVLQEAPSHSSQSSTQEAAPNTISQQTMEQARSKIISDLMPGATVEDLTKFNTKLDEVLANQPRYDEKFLQDVLNRWGPAVYKEAPKLGMSPYLLFGVILTECDGDPTAVSPNSDVVGSGMKVATAQESGLRVDLANGIDERTDISKVVPAMVYNMNRYGKYIDGGQNPAWKVIVYKAGVGKVESFIETYDRGQHPSLVEAARATNPTRVLNDSEVMKKVSDKDDLEYMQRVADKGSQMEAFVNSQNQASVPAAVR